MFKNRSNTIGKIATNVYSEDGWTHIRYHQTVVVRFNERFIILDSGGWSTNTTKTRINQASGQFELKLQVFQVDWSWIVKLPNGQEVRFVDGLKIDRMTGGLYQPYTVNSLADATLTVYSGDVNPEYGGMFVDLSTWTRGFVGLTRLTDMSNAECDGIVAVEQGYLNIPKPTTILSALNSSGGIRGKTSKDRQLSIVDALVFYMGFDVDRTLYIQTDQDQPMNVNGLKADIRLSDRESILDWLVVNQGWIET